MIWRLRLASALYFARARTKASSWTSLRFDRVIVCEYLFREDLRGRVQAREDWLQGATIALLGAGNSNLE